MARCAKPNQEGRLCNAANMLQARCAAEPGSVSVSRPSTTSFSLKTPLDIDGVRPRDVCPSLHFHAPPPRRHPLAAAPNHYAVNQQPRHAPPPAPGTPPPKQQERPKQPASPPLPRQNAKVTPPSPPKIITDKSRTLEFMRVGMLGEVCTLQPHHISTFGFRFNHSPMFFNVGTSGDCHFGVK